MTDKLHEMRRKFAQVNRAWFCRKFLAFCIGNLESVEIGLIVMTKNTLIEESFRNRINESLIERIKEITDSNFLH